MNSVEERVHPNDNTFKEFDEDEIQHQIKKWSEENQQKLKQAKNLEDLVKIKLSTVNTVKKDKNLFWRNLVNNSIKPDKGYSSQLGTKRSPHTGLNTSKEGIHIDRTPEMATLEETDNAYNTAEHTKYGSTLGTRTNLDPVSNLNSYFKNKEFIPPKKSIKPTKKIVYKDKTSEMADMFKNPINPYDANNLNSEQDAK